MNTEKIIEAIEASDGLTTGWFYREDIGCGCIVGQMLIHAKVPAKAFAGRLILAREHFALLRDEYALDYGDVSTLISLNDNMQGFGLVRYRGDDYYLVHESEVAHPLISPEERKELMLIYLRTGALE